ncbi:nuclear transport factor 2 family protein [Robiginitalea sp. SC105]|uniref:nuclear transport factor 2 family protein n=1 Tax=Robiginitalea sp. SC105 TaxID=2762332 RepID=UPI00163A7849|nr:nuclear transport factor 2 family protein [Robiginitalea sp. SC105]MBC2838164.1 nuclear transport factor 2 family protein [Robiginitalea sp. SC105]
MKNTSTLLFILLATGCSNSVEYDREKIQKEALEIAESWNKAWNGDIDIDRIMSLHHKDLQYYWHGKPLSYAGFEEVLKKYVIGVETYNNKLFNPVVTVIEENNVIVGFQLGDSLEDVEKDENAFTLVLTRVGSEWKIIHIHEG